MSYGKYLHVALQAVRDQFVYLKSFLGRSVFFVVILFIFYSLWRVIFRDEPIIAGLSMSQTLWYLTITETIELAKVRVFAQVQQEVKDGTIAYTLGRPYSYPAFIIARAFGESIVRMLPILVLGFASATLFVGVLPGYFRALPFGLILIAGGSLLNTMWMLLFGLLAFWTEDVTPFYWIYQKLVFILGGMFFPIDFFPDWLAGISRALPFAYSAYWPGYVMVNYSVEAFLRGATGQIVYIAAMSGVIWAVYATAVRRVHVQGG
jgi:ABC-2 type transport system permease protein